MLLHSVSMRMSGCAILSIILRQYFGMSVTPETARLKTPKKTFILNSLFWASGSLKYFFKWPQRQNGVHSSTFLMTSSLYSSRSIFAATSMLPFERRSIFSSSLSQMPATSYEQSVKIKINILEMEKNNWKTIFVSLI